MAAQSSCAISTASLRLPEMTIGWCDSAASSITEKIITRNGESYVALIDARRLYYYHQLERERIHLLLLDDAGKGLADVAAGKVKDARSTVSAIQRRHAAKALR